MKQLIIDIGNTLTKLAWFQAGQLMEKKMLPHGSNNHIDWNVFWDIITTVKSNQAIVASTKHLPDSFIQKGEEEFERFIVLTAETPLPIQLNYDTLQTLGVDRIALAVALSEICPNQNAIAIDFGTCITLEVVSEQNTYEGGFILPGLNMQLKSMHHYTDKLPLFSTQDIFEENHDFQLGKSTKQAMTFGVIESVSSMIDGLIQKIENKYGVCNVILTGGDAQSFETRLKSKIFVHPNLVLEGLNKILIYNAS